MKLLEVEWGTCPRLPLSWRRHWLWRGYFSVAVQPIVCSEGSLWSEPSRIERDADLCSINKLNADLPH